MVSLKNKKGAVELSLNLIIMLIIGMVVLGLVIGFVTKLVNQGTAGFDTQLGDNEKLKLEEVKSCSDNLCVIPSPSITIQKGAKSNVFIKVRAFVGNIDCGAGEIEGCTDLEYEVLDSEGQTSTDSMKLLGPGILANEGTEDAQMYTLNVDKTAEIGTYYLKFSLYPTDDENKVSKTITINVE